MSLVTNMGNNGKGLTGKKLVIILGLFMILAIIMVVAKTHHQERYSDKIHPGAKLKLKENSEFTSESFSYFLDKITDIDKLKAGKVKELFEQELSPGENKVTFVIEDKENWNEKDDIKSWSYNLDDLKLNYKPGETIDKIISVWKNQGYFKILSDMIGLRPYSLEKELAFEIDEEKLEQRIGKLKDEINKAPRKASYFLDETTGKLELKESKKGKKVDHDQTINYFKQGIKYKFGELISGDKIKVPLAIETTLPEITTQRLKDKEIDTKTSDFETQFDPDKKNRAYNIDLAASYFYGSIISPGETISFNEAISELRENDSLKKAPIIVDKEFVDGSGGGVCQVSSTFYNAALKAGLKIVERHNHSRPITYLPLGRDAAVAYDYLDLKVKNPFEEHVLIFSYTEANNLIFKIFGPKNLIGGKDNYKIVSTDYKEIEPPIEYEKNKDKEAGYEEKVQEGLPGYEISTWRYKLDRENGQVLKREFLYTDYYKPVPRIYEIGVNNSKY